MTSRLDEIDKPGPPNDKMTTFSDQQTELEEGTSPVDPLFDDTMHGPDDPTAVLEHDELS